ncbi:MAG: hypothetical protein NC489_24545 [Ruminococcus flavefaciens]|nr:hypothetical protein [Ruminococcus flavefaciens]
MENREIYGADRMDVDTETIVPENISYQASINIIRQKLINPQDTFICIGWHLKHIKQGKLYQQEQYKNIYEFAAGKFRMKKSKVSRFINLCEQFSVNHDSPQIAEEYKEFSMSQLEEMLSMDPEDRAKITSDMTIKQIREVKRKAGKRKKKEQREEDVPGEIVAMSQQSEPEQLSYRIKKDQPKIVKMINSQERRKWLENVEKWGLWYEDPNIQARYYKYDFEDGSRLIAVKYRYTCPPYMKEQPKQYREQIKADGSYYGTPIYHMIYSEYYWEKHQEEFRKEYKRNFTDHAASISELENFLIWLQGNSEWGDSFMYVEFDSNHLKLTKREEKEIPFVTRKYIDFFREHGYIPKQFYVQDATEITDYAQTLGTNCGTFQGTGAVSFFDLLENIVDVMEDESYSLEERQNEVIKLLLIASPEEREKAEKRLYKRVIGREEWQERWRERRKGDDLGTIRFKISNFSVEDCFKLIGMTTEDVRKAKEIGASNTQLYKAAGNGIVPDCVSLIAEHIYKAQYDSSFVCTDEKMNAKQDAEKHKK